MTIPKGTDIYFPSFTFHKDPEYWENPEEFDVLRY